MNNSRLSLRLLIIAFISAFTLMSCSNEQSAIKKPLTTKGNRKELKMIYWQAPTILNPHLSTGFKDAEASRITLEPLATFNQEGKLIPILAQDIPSQENGGIAEDGLSVTWKLRQDIKWSDGKPFTAKDVVLTYDFITNPAVGSVTSGDYAIVKKVEAIDPYTVKVHFNNVTPAWYTIFVGNAGLILPAHLYADYNGENAREAPYNLRPIGTGPYQVSLFKPGDSVIYEPNPYYRDADKLAFAKVEIKGGGDATSAARAVLQTGDADFAYNLQVEAKVLEELAQGGTGKLITNFGALSERILLNYTDPNRSTSQGERASLKFPHPFLSDVKVRQALALTTNQAIIANQLYGVTGKATPNFLVAPPEYVSTANQVKYNLEKAAQLLDEAGWKDSNGNGIRDKNGVEMKLVFQTSVNPLRQKTQAVVKQSWESLGLEVELKSVDASVFFSSDPSNNDTVEHFYADVQMFTTGNLNPDPTPYFKTYKCDNIPQKSNNWTGDNYSRYCNPKYDQLWEQVTTELDADIRADIFKKLNDILVQEAVIIPLIHRAEVVGVSNQLKGVDLTPWDSRTWNIAQWYKTE
jgi:peptide/nickel transport system substrate-binding protein